MDVGQKTLALAGYATPGDACQILLCKRVNAQPTEHEGWVRTVDRYKADGTEDATNGGYWEYVIPVEGIRIEWFGGKSDGVTDNSPAYVKAEKCVTSFYFAGVYQFYRGGPKILFGHGGGTNGVEPYQFNSPIQPTRSVHLEGAHAGNVVGNSGWPTKLRFAVGIKGVILRGHVGTAGATTTNGAAFTHLENLFFESAGKGGFTDKHGIDVSCQFSMRNCRVTGFGGHGIVIAADVHLGTPSNSNLWLVERVWCAGNAGHGICAFGGDTNAGMATMLNCSNNALYGIYDDSFLGNTWVACHTSQNPGGGYYASGVNARSCFVGCYSEGDDGPSYCGPTVTFIGGLIGPQVVSGGAFYDGGNIKGAIRHYPPQVELATDNIYYVSRPKANVAYQFGPGVGLSVSPHDWFYDQANGGFFMRFASLGGNYSYGITAATNTMTAGKPLASEVGANEFLLPRGVYLSGGNQTAFMRKFDLNPLAPTGGVYARGEFRLNSTSTAGGNAGWVCTTAGGKAADWVSGTNYNVNSYIKTDEGKYYHCVVDPGIALSTVKPTHTSGDVTDADGYGWRFLSLIDAVWSEFGPIANLPGTIPYVNASGSWSSEAVFTYDAALNSLSVSGIQGTNGAAPTALTIYPRGEYHLSSIPVPGGPIGWVATTGGGQSALWITGANWGLTALVKNSVGRFYTCILDPGGAIVSTEEPVHLTGDVTYADGYGWRFQSNDTVIWTPFGNTLLQNTATYDPPSLAAGAVDAIQTMTVTGAALGDLVDASFTLNLNGAVLAAWVSAANTVAYQFRNPTAAALDLGSGTVKCRVRK